MFFLNLYNLNYLLSVFKINFYCVLSVSRCFIWVQNWLATTYPQKPFMNPPAGYVGRRLYHTKQASLPLSRSGCR